MGSCHVELAGLVAGAPRPYTLPVFSKKGTLQVELTALNFSVLAAPPGDPQITANKQLAAESARKRAAYKKVCEKGYPLLDVISLRLFFRASPQRST
jgi:hypothetical protein